MLTADRIAWNGVTTDPNAYHDAVAQLKSAPNATAIEPAVHQSHSRAMSVAGAPPGGAAARAKGVREGAPGSTGGPARALGLTAHGAYEPAINSSERRPAGEITGAAADADGAAKSSIAASEGSTPLRTPRPFAAPGRSRVAEPPRAIPSKSALRDVGGANPSIDLAATEKGAPGKPHTLLRHINADITARFADPRIKASSTYRSLAAAQRAVDHTIGTPPNQHRIETWVAGGAKGSLRLDARVPGDPVGTWISRSAFEAGKTPEPTNNAAVVLKADSSSAARYFVLTSFPSEP